MIDLGLEKDIADKNILKDFYAKDQKFVEVLPSDIVLERMFSKQPDDMQESPNMNNNSHDSISSIYTDSIINDVSELDSDHEIESIQNLTIKSSPALQGKVYNFSNQKLDDLDPFMLENDRNEIRADGNRLI